MILISVMILKIIPQLQKRTAGFQDMWCPHQTKVGSIMQTLKESVTDPCDLIHCMKKLPKLHICDDACTLGRGVGGNEPVSFVFRSNFLLFIIFFSVSHMFLRYPEESATTLGDRRGCFEPPSAKNPPSNVVCHDILPINRQKIVTNPALMRDPDPTKHPDSDNQNRYVMGTRLQAEVANQLNW